LRALIAGFVILNPRYGGGDIT